MGVKPSFPLQLTPINYEEAESFTPSGQLRKDFELHTDITDFERITKKFFGSLVDERERMIEAKRKLQTIDYAAYSKKYNWTESQIADLCVQFNTFDQNQDGIIDYEELRRALDELGDHSSEEERKVYFDSIDDDHSNGIDFDEYIKLVHGVLGNRSNLDGTRDKIGDLCAHGAEKATKVRKLSVLEQIEAGVF